MNNPEIIMQGAADVGSSAVLGVMVKINKLFKLIQPIMQSFYMRLSSIHIRYCPSYTFGKLALVLCFVFSQNLAQALPFGAGLESLKAGNGSSQNWQTILKENNFLPAQGIEAGSQICYGVAVIIEGGTSSLPPEHQESGAGSQSTAEKSSNNATHDNGCGFGLQVLGFGLGSFLTACLLIWLNLNWHHWFWKPDNHHDRE